MTTTSIVLSLLVIFANLITNSHSLLRQKTIYPFAAYNPCKCKSVVDLYTFSFILNTTQQCMYAYYMLFSFIHSYYVLSLFVASLSPCIKNNYNSNVNKKTREMMMMTLDSAAMACNNISFAFHYFLFSLCMQVCMYVCMLDFIYFTI